MFWRYFLIKFASPCTALLLKKEQYLKPETIVIYWLHSTPWVSNQQHTYTSKKLCVFRIQVSRVHDRQIAQSCGCMFSSSKNGMSLTWASLGWIYVYSEGYFWWKKVINLAQRLLDSHANTIMNYLDIIERDISFQKVIIIPCWCQESDVRSGRGYSSLAWHTISAP